MSSKLALCVVGTCTSVCACTYVCVRVRGYESQRSGSGVVPHETSTLFYESDFLTRLEHAQ